MIKYIKKFVRENKILFGLYKKLRFVKNIPAKDFFDFRKLYLFSRVYPYTMVGPQKLSNVYELAGLVEKSKTKGAFVECGVWKGGCVAVMAFVADRAGFERKIWLFDSFEGLPEPTAEDGAAAREYSLNRASGELSTIDKCVGPLEDVKKIFFDILKINPKNVEIVKGWFQKTLPENKDKIGPIAILRIDGDWYESTKCCLDNLYDKVISGGYIIDDDYGCWEGSRRAIGEFFKGRNISPTLIKIDNEGVYFKKP